MVFLNRETGKPIFNEYTLVTPGLVNWILNLPEKRETALKTRQEGDNLHVFTRQKNRECRMVVDD